MVVIIAIFAPIFVFGLWSLYEIKNATTPLRFLQFGQGYQASSFFATLLASNSSLSGALFLIAFYGMLFGPSIFVWVFLFWVSTQAMSYYVIKWVESVKPGFIERRGTLHEFVGELFGGDSNVRIAAARMSAFAYIGLLGAEIAIGYGIVSAIVPGTIEIFGRLSLEPLLITLMALGTVAGYCTMSGFRGVVRTDELQLILIFTMMIAVAVELQSTILFFSLISLLIVGMLASILYWKWHVAHDEVIEPDRTVGSSTPKPLSVIDILRDVIRRWPALLAFLSCVVVWYFSSHELGYSVEVSAVINPTPDPWHLFIPFFVIANVLFWLMWWPAAMDQWHRCAATTSTGTSQHWLLGTLGVLPICYLGLLSLTFLYVGSNVSADQGIIADPLGGYMLGLTADDASPMIFIAFAVGLVAAMVSTTDTYLVVASQTLTLDISEASRTNHSLIEAEEAFESAPRDSNIMNRLRWSIVMTFLTSVVISLAALVLLTDVFALIYLVFSGQFVIAGVLLAGFFLRDPDHRSQLATTAKNATYIGFTYVIASNLVLIPMLEFSLREMLPGDAWYSQSQYWYYAIYSNPILIALLTSGVIVLKQPRSA